MSLNFTNPSDIAFSIGAVAGVGTSPFTMLALWRPANNFTSFITALGSGTTRRAMLLDTAHLFGNNDFSSGFQTLAPVTDWWWLGLSLDAAGDHYQGHVQDYSSGGAWAHGEAAGAGAQAFTAVSDTIQLGTGVTPVANGDLAVAAIWTSFLTPAQIEAAATAHLSDLMAAHPGWAVAAPLANGLAALQDLTGNGGNETGRTAGITAVADPPSYNFTVGGTPVLMRRAGRR